MKMPFGKHKGVELDEVDEGYLRWLLTTDIPKPYLRQAIEDKFGASAKAAPKAETSRQEVDVDHKIELAKATLKAKYDAQKATTLKHRGIVKDVFEQLSPGCDQAQEDIMTLALSLLMQRMWD